MQMNDIQSETQRRVVYTRPGSDSETSVKVLRDSQIPFLLSTYAEQGARLEQREIVVTDWVPVDPDNLGDDEG